MDTLETEAEATYLQVVNYLQYMTQEGLLTEQEFEEAKRSLAVQFGQFLP